MPLLEGAFPELVSFVFGLILSAFGVPSPVEIGIRIILAFEQSFPSSMNIFLIAVLRIFGWFLIIEAVLRIIVLARKGQYF